MIKKNNLMNITNEDFIYQLILQRIEGYLPKDLQDVYRACEQIQLIATDCYFLHYSLYPFLRSKNDDEILEEARRFIQDYISTERFQRIKMLTTLDDEMSLAYSIALAKAVLGKVLGVMRLHDLPKVYVRSVLASMGGEIPAILEYATEYAEEMVKNANDVRELIGGKKAGKEEGTFKKVLDLAEHMLYVKFMRDVVSFSKKLFSHIPKATYIFKRRGRFGDELSGYSITKRADRALVRELALPEELFIKKLSSDGFLTKEKLSIAEGAYYILVDKCLSGETLITLEDGDEVEIRDVDVGDYVLSVKLDELKLDRAKVIEVKIDFKDVLEVLTPYNRIRMTENHILPVYRDGGIVEISAGDLRVGDQLVGEDFAPVPVKGLKRFGKAEVYDLILEKDHHFIANGVVVHNSGSMVGEKTVWARSVALAIYRMANVKKRKYFLRFFDKKVHNLLYDPHEVVDAILKVQSNGGTDITNALEIAIEDLIERGLSDYTNTIVIITDGEDVVEDVSKGLRKANANLISVMIQGDNDTLKALSDCYMKAELSEIGGAKLLKVVEVS